MARSFPVDRATGWKILAGFTVAGVVLYFVASQFGLGEVVDTLAGADLRWLAVGCLSTLLCLVLWGKAWHIVLRVAGIEVPFRKLVSTYFAATFANYITPLGQAGGEPFIAYVLSRDTEASYEESLASVVTADLLNLLPFFSFSAIGLSVLLAQSSLPGAAQSLAWGLLAMAVGVPVLVGLAWRFRERVRGGVLRLVRPIAGLTSRVSVDGVAARIDELYESFGRIAQDRRALVVAVAFAYAGWVFFALPLYFAGKTLAIPGIDPLLVLFVVPASTLAGLTPSPGGTGGVELALVALLVALTPVSNAVALSIALVYRVMSYWFALVVGGLAAVGVVARS